MKKKEPKAIQEQDFKKADLRRLKGRRAEYFITKDEYKLIKLAKQMGFDVMVAHGGFYPETRFDLFRLEFEIKITKHKFLT